MIIMLYYNLCNSNYSKLYQAQIYYMYVCAAGFTEKVKIEYLNYLIDHFTVLWNNQEI